MSKSARASTADPTLHRSPGASNSVFDFDTQRKYKNQQYLTPRHLPISAQSSRSHYHLNKKQLNGVTHAKLEIKTPTMTSSFNETQMKTKINRLGLENFMKQIVLADKIPDPNLSSKVIYAMNKTYLANNIEAPQQKLPTSFGQKSLRYSRKVESPKVQWNPENCVPQHHFQQFTSFIPNTMFPCRRGKTTRLLKSRQKSRKQSSCQSFLKPEKPKIQQLLKSSQNYRLGISLNLQNNSKRSNSIKNMSYNRKWSSSRLNNKSVQVSQKFIGKSIQRQNKMKQHNLYEIRKAKIYY